jgi:hypothetical protein
MKSVLLFLVLLASCTTTPIALKSDFQKLSERKSGTLLTINLKTNGHIREGRNCHLNFEDDVNKYELILNEGIWDYALPFNQNQAELTKITCGPFYYYDLRNQGAKFKFTNDKIKYLGILNFELEEKGKMEWGLATINKDKLNDRILEMGLDQNNVEIDILKI